MLCSLLHGYLTPIENTHLFDFFLYSQGAVDMSSLVQRLHPAFVAGVLFSVAWFIFADAAIIANSEPDPKNHFTFTMAIPSIFSFIAFMTINLTKPSNFHDASPRERGLLFCGWVLALSSSVGAIGTCGAHFVGDGTRVHSFPGAALVIHSCLISAAAVALWWAKGEGGSFGDDLQW